VGPPCPDIVAHRGASYDAPENTLASFRLAWRKRADAIEGDFRMTGDGKIVCMHDKTTKRTGNADLEVVMSSLARLRQLDVGSWKDVKWSGERIPTLEEVFETIPNCKKIFMEIKCGPEIIPALKDAIFQSGLEPDQTIVISFKERVIAEAKKQMPHMKAFWITDYREDERTGEWRPSPEEVHAYPVVAQASISIRVPIPALYSQISSIHYRHL